MPDRCGGQGEAVVLVKVIPNAPRDALEGMRAGEYLVRLSAPPVEGRANEALVAFLAETLGCRRSDIRVLGGLASRHKRLALPFPALERLKGLVKP